MVLQYMNSLTSGAPQSEFATVVYPMKTILAAYKKPAAAPQSPKPRRPATINGKSSSGATSSSCSGASGSENNAASSAWMNHVWLGLINKSWDEYHRDNPPPVTALGAAGGEDGGEGDANVNINVNADMDEFILDPQRTKTELAQRKQIRELVLAHLSKQHQL